MIFLETVGLFLATVLVSYICGYGAVTFLLPTEYKEYRFIIMPPVGYTIFAWAAYTLSGTFTIPVKLSCLLVFAALALLALASYIIERPEEEGRSILKGVGKAGLIAGALLLIVLWPLFYIGADTYLGAVNPDYFSSFIDNDYLLTHAVTINNAAFDSYSFMTTVSGRLPPSARFGSSLNSILLQGILGIPARTAMTLSIALFITCLPLSVFFMARVAVGFSKRAALIASALIGISGCVTMSYVYFYVGQNSGMGSLPVALTILYILLIKPSWRIVLFSALLVSSFFVMYMGMLPYALAPVGVLGLYMVFKGQMKFRQALLLALGTVAMIVLVNGGMLRYTAQAFKGWSAIVGMTLQGQYFLDFLTEQYFPIFYGVANYPIAASYIFRWMGPPALPFVVGLSGILFVPMTLFFVHWIKNTHDRRQVVLVVGGVVIFVIVWSIYSFVRQYGYAIFKMSSWLQFLQVLPWAYGFDKLWIALKNERVQSRRLLIGGALASLFVLIVGGNLLSSVRLGVFSLGKDTEHGYIVNNYDMSGNHDYFQLAAAMKPLVKKDQSIGYAFTDVIQNSWVSYYLRDYKMSFLTHFLFPSDDENLPDIITRGTVDYYGNFFPDWNRFFHADSDSYYLTWNESHLNKEIIEQRLPKPLWENKTFRLIDAAKAPDFLVTGRGWYRLEYRNSDAPDSWWPHRYRWSAEGGELYMFRAAHPGKSYRISFLGIVGYGLPSPKRTIEFWQNTEKFGEVTIDEAARVVSPPFYPTKNFDRVILKIKEHVRALPRRFRLWNLDVPEDYRRLNVAAAEIRLIGPDEKIRPGPERLEGKELFTQCIAFNGIKMNQWVGDSMSIALAPPSGYTGVDIATFVPGHRALKFPLTLTVEINGVKEQRVVTRPGIFNMSIPCKTPQVNTPVNIRIWSDQSFVPDGVDAVNRPERQSFRLQRIQFTHFNSPVQAMANEPKGKSQQVSH